MTKNTPKSPKEAQTSSGKIPDQVTMADASMKDLKETKIIYRVFQGRDIRFEKTEEGALAVALDVAKILGYADPDDAIKQHCKSVRKIKVNDGKQDRPMLVIPEADIYRLVMRSKMPEAQKFEEWVTGEVLPSIRKTGKYKITRKISYGPVNTNENANPGEQLDFFPRSLNLTFHADVATKLGAERNRLKAEGVELATEKDLISYIVTKYFEEVAA